MEKMCLLPYHSREELMWDVSCTAEPLQLAKYSTARLSSRELGPMHLEAWAGLKVSRYDHLNAIVTSLSNG